jgi:hypothetical protein
MDSYSMPLEGSNYTVMIMQLDNPTKERVVDDMIDIA